MAVDVAHAKTQSLSVVMKILDYMIKSQTKWLLIFGLGVGLFQAQANMPVNISVPGFIVRPENTTACLGETATFAVSGDSLTSWIRWEIDGLPILKSERRTKTWFGRVRECGRIYKFLKIPNIVEQENLTMWLSHFLCNHCLTETF